MAIAKKPFRNSSLNKKRTEDEVAENFISAADKKLSDQPKRKNKIPIMIRFDPDLLIKVDEAAHKRGVSRSAWLQYTMSRALENGEG